jgi:HlyD family secretion protein
LRLAKSAEASLAVAADTKSSGTAARSSPPSGTSGDGPSKPKAKPKLPKWVVPVIVALCVIAAGAAGAWYWWQQQQNALPAGIAMANGRVEATQVDIATKIPGRIVEIVPHEGDMVDAGSVVARLDKAEIEAQLDEGRAEAQRARRQLARVEADIAARKADLLFAEQELDRSAKLVIKGFTPREKYDQRKQLLDSATAALAAANAAVGEAQAAIKAADANVERLLTNLNDTTVTAPVRGRVQYRLIEPGAVLSAGGRIATVLDLSDVYMTVFLPASVAGQLTIGDEARIVVDAAPQFVFPANVSFVAPESQFTPKSVETQSEREQLYFRVKLKAPPEILKGMEERVKSGLRGIGYVRVDPAAPWPAWLDVKLPNA